MLYVDGMNGLISHNETVQWLYTLVGSKFRLVVKTSLKLLLVFVEYTECNAALLIKAVSVVDAKRGESSGELTERIKKQLQNTVHMVLFYRFSQHSVLISALILCGSV
uniref:FHOD1/3-like FH3 domain-containing protein n=1 Tax=Amphiprion percula TaxID=161767 RepID=A0A3P8T3N7_AMPPE